MSVLLFLLILISDKANAYCIDNWACFEVERHSSQVHVYLINKKEFPITATIRLDTINLEDRSSKTLISQGNDYIVREQPSNNSASHEFEVTRVLHQVEKMKVLTLTPIDFSKRYRISETFNWTPGDMHAQHDDDYRYQRPFAEGQNFRVVQGYGGGYSHRGASKYALDFDMPEGTPVHAARAGLVIDLTEHNWRGGASRRYARYANFVTLLHSDGTTGEYYHLKKNGVTVSLGDQVKAGELIGYSGNTGFSSMPHLHFAVYRAKPRGKYESLPVRFKQPIRSRVH